jgi:hypothetical protein
VPGECIQKEQEGAKRLREEAAISEARDLKVIELHECAEIGLTTLILTISLSTGHDLHVKMKRLRLWKSKWQSQDTNQDLFYSKKPMFLPLPSYCIRRKRMCSLILKILVSYIIGSPNQSQLV